MTKKILGISFLLILLILFPKSSCLADSVTNKIKKVSLSKSETGYNIKFELSKIAVYKIFKLSNPSRLVVDFDNSTLNTNVDTSKFTLFSSFRSGNDKNGNLRLVFALSDEIKINKSTAINPGSDNKNYSLNIEITKVKVVHDSKESKKYSLTPLNSLIADNILDGNAKAKNTNSKKTFITKEVPKERVVKKSSSNKKVIIIDAGHGGKDPGAIGYAKTKEKNVTLAFAREIKKYLDKTQKFKVYLTRDTDDFISLSDRVRKSQNLKADLFISIHADSAENRSASGLSVYTLSEKSSDKEAEKLANKENKSDIFGGVNFSGASEDILKILIDLSQRSTMNNSAKFAEFIIKELSKNEIHVKQDTHRFAGFRVLTAPDVPSILIELGYLSNKDDEKKLNSIYYRRKFAQVLTENLNNYFRN